MRRCRYVRAWRACALGVESFTLRTNSTVRENIQETATTRGVKSCAWLASHLRPIAIVMAAMSATACSRHEAPRAVLAEQCERVQDNLPWLVRVQAPAAGEFLVRVVPKGISVILDIDHERARSQVDRFGVITFVRQARANEQFIVSVFSRDSPDIAGEACVTVSLLSSSDTARMRAERAFAAAGRHVQ